MRDILKFDTMIAALALMMSSVTAGAMLYQTHVIEEQFAATVWPYLSVETTYNPNRIAIALINDGAGPALVRSGQVLIDGTPVKGWGAVVRSIVKHINPARVKHANMSSQMSSVDAALAIRAAENRSLVVVGTNDPLLMAEVRKHRLELRFCYCSINERCWTIDSHIGTNHVDIPRPVGACTSNASISAF